METKRFTHLIIPFICFSVMAAKAQVGIGTITPDSSSALEVYSTTQGFLPPRMSTVDRDAIENPATGLVLWCNDCGEFGELQVYNGTNWKNISGSSSGGLAIGDAYGGGIVAYILQAGDPGYIEGETHGIIAAPFDQTDSIAWGCMGDTIPGAEGIAVGTGHQNTQEILAACLEQDIAAMLCDDMEILGYDDWHLPSRDELIHLYLHREIIGGFSAEFYWSSTEQSMNAAWGHNFGTGYQAVNYKFVPEFVRAVRAF